MREWPEHDARVDIGISESNVSDAEGSIRVLTPSGTMLFDIRIPWKAYALAVLRSRGAQPAMVRVYAPELLGAEEERKTLPVRFDSFSPRDDAKALALKPFEVDGWRGRQSDLGNMHRRDKHGLYEVTFTRHTLGGHPIEPVGSIPHVVQAAQRALEVLSKRGGDAPEEAIQDAMDILAAALRKGAD